MPGARLPEEAMAMRVAKEFRDGMLVNLGIGLPVYCASYVPPEVEILSHSENGLLGYGAIITDREEADPNLVVAGGQSVRRKPGMAIFDQAESFAIVRGGRLDLAVLGAFEVSERGDLANWCRPGKEIASTIGGGMDIACSARRIIAMMTHTTSENRPKIVRECSAPLTAPRCVSLIVTDIAVIEVAREGLVLKEVAPGWTPEEVQALTEPQLILAPDLSEMTLS